MSICLGIDCDFNNYTNCDLSLGYFLGNNKILVKINDEAKKEILQSFYHYGDYRLGCSLCNKGDAYSFKNNIKKLSNDKNEFFLNELKIIGKFKFNFMQLVKIDDKQLIKQLYNDYYKKYFTNRLQDNIKIKKKIIKQSENINKIEVDCFSYSHLISSIFDEVKDSNDEENNDYFEKHIDIDVINSINLCSVCLSWVNILENKINNVENIEFKKKIKPINLMECHWKNYVKKYILENPDTFLLDDENRKILYNWCHDLCDEILN